MYTIKHYNRKPIKVREYTRGTSWQRRLGQWVWSWLRMPVIYALVAIIFMSSIASAFFYGELYDHENNPQTIAMASFAHADTTDNSDLARIEFAESRNNQFCDTDAIAHKMCSQSQNGLVLTRVNNNGSLDIGIAQINDKTWGAQATALGYDLYTKEGNEAMAKWIISKYGTKPWYLSAKTWK